ncbi:MAG: polysaccharide deacetylase family protein [Betaproteobacteria bacterium]
MPDNEYIVRPGDTLYAIAAAHNTTVSELVRLNAIRDPNLIYPGQRIILPAAPGGVIRYTIAPGDTFYALAGRFGTTVETITRANPGVNPYNLQVGQQILIPARVEPVAIFRGNPQKPLVALTFDATYGDNQTEVLLSILAREGITATWFISGIWAEAFPTLLQAIEAAGHEIGNHSMTHPHMTQLSAAAMASEITRATQAIEARTARRVNLFRPPFGEYNQTLLNVAAELGHRTIMWTVDSLDWMEPPPPPEEIASRVLAAVGNGAIALMHNAGRNTPAALPAIISGIRRAGLGFGTVSQVLDP